MKISIKEFFEMVTKTIAEPNTTITEQDKRKAIRVFLYLDEFMMENVPEYCGDTPVIPSLVRLTLGIMLLVFLMKLREND
jgi:hypothetical protein